MPLIPANKPIYKTYKLYITVKPLIKSFVIPSKSIRENPPFYCYFTR
jgi:hypothetical protein